MCRSCRRRYRAILNSVPREPIMVTGVGVPTFGSQSAFPGSTGGGSVSALQGQIQRARVQLNDWTTCVSAKTPKGQSEIQKLSGEISGDKQKIARAQQSEPAPAARSDSSNRSATSTRVSAGSVDIWV
jgi:hypothetical protein